MHYAEQAANAAKAGNSGIPVPSPFPGVDMNDHATAPYHGDPSQTSPNEFRARFHRSLVAPSPFRTFTAEGQNAAAAAAAAAVANSTSSSASGSGPPSDPIDPHLNGTVTTEQRQQPPSNLDPDLGPARAETAAVVAS
jgi:hypothetical protein